MNKTKIGFTILASALIFSNCNTSKKTADAPVVKKISYNKDIKPIIANSCTPCHFPPKGRKEPLESYEHVKQYIDDILVRVKLPKTDVGFMPPNNKKPALNDSLIAVLVNWQKQNMPE